MIVVGQAYPHPYNTLETFTGLKRLQALSIRAGPALLWMQGSCFLSAGVAAGCLNFEHCSFSEMGFDSNIIATDVRTTLQQQEPEKTGGRLWNCAMNHMCSKWKTAANSIPIWPHGIPPFFLVRCLFAAYWPWICSDQGGGKLSGFRNSVQVRSAFLPWRILGQSTSSSANPRETFNDVQRINFAEVR